eukprot:SM000259S08749  [mRNA]  locus=s259:135499:140355:- [translate_table: standard]
MEEIKGKAEQNELMVQEICRDIKKLDFAKKHITTTITALHRLAMLVSAVEQLQGMAAKRQYKDAAGQLEVLLRPLLTSRAAWQPLHALCLVLFSGLQAVNQLCGHFEAYRDIPKITELRNSFEAVKQSLRYHVFSDFSSLGSAVPVDSAQQMQQLAEACLVVDALGPAVRDELVQTVCAKELTAYQQIFEGTEVAKLEKTERRYAWIKRQLRANEDVWQIFPQAWRVQYLLCMQFSKVTRFGEAVALAPMLAASKALHNYCQDGRLVVSCVSDEWSMTAMTLACASGPSSWLSWTAQKRNSTWPLSCRQVSEVATHILLPFLGKPWVACRHTRLSSPISHVRLLQALQRTLEFEEELDERFVTSERQGAQQRDPDNEALDSTPLDRAVEAKGAGVRGSFRGVMSSCFEPHLTIYVELEERTLMEVLEKLIQEETWEAEEGSQPRILASSTQVFLHIKRSFNRCSALTRSLTLFKLYKVFQRLLRAYANRLGGRLPKAGTGIVAAATATDVQAKVSPISGAGPYVLLSDAGCPWQLTDREERVCCYIVNTAEYCHETVPIHKSFSIWQAGQLAESIGKVIEPQYRESVDMSEEQDEFSGVITRALSVLVLSFEAKLETELQKMIHMPWGQLDAVGDQSEYVNGIRAILHGGIPLASGLLSILYFQYFMDKLAASFAPRFYISIFKCKRISETGAQQMLLDTHAVKTLLLEAPSLGSQLPIPSSYSKYVIREIGKAEALLKVLLSPSDAIADTYRALLPDGTSADFQRILDLKGMKKPDQQAVVDNLARKGSFAGPDTPTAPTSGLSSAPLSGGAAQLMSPSTTATAASSLATAASREAMMARAAALGRGAMAQSAAAAAAVSSTSLKRIFALAESAKEGSKKDGTFRKLFNA